MGLNKEAVEHLVNFIIETKEKKSAKQNDLLSRYINLEGLLSLNAFLKEKLRQNDIPKNISCQTNHVLSKIPELNDTKTQKYMEQKLLESTISSINRLAHDIAKQDKNSKLLN